MTDGKTSGREPAASAVPVTMAWHQDWQPVVGTILLLVAAVQIVGSLVASLIVGFQNSTGVSLAGSGDGVSLLTAALLLAAVILLATPPTESTHIAARARRWMLWCAATLGIVVASAMVIQGIVIAANAPDAPLNVAAAGARSLPSLPIMPGRGTIGGALTRHARGGSGVRLIEAVVMMLSSAVAFTAAWLAARKHRDIAASSGLAQPAAAIILGFVLSIALAVATIVSGPTQRFAPGGTGGGLHRSGQIIIPPSNGSGNSSGSTPTNPFLPNGRTTIP